MICGTVVLEDTILNFRLLPYDADVTDPKELMTGEGVVKYVVSCAATGAEETKIVGQSKFFKALAIAVHNDGMPDYKVDYADAESIQPVNKDLRWIP